MKTILVVDDSKTYLTLAKQALDEVYHVTPVLSGAQALKFLEKRRPDLILMDIHMPEMDGKETLRRIKTQPEWTDIPVIFLTASAEPETEVECLELGAIDFITKPFVPQVMRVRIARTLELEEFRQQAEQKARRFESIASKDSLTGLWNRAYLAQQLPVLLHAGHQVAFLMIDVDHFKSVNDKFGHIMGDTVLKRLAALLQEGFPNGMVGRIGGDEFAVLLQEPFSRDTLTAHLEVFQRTVNEDFEATTSGIATISIGIAEAPKDGEDFRVLYDKADKALYLVKNEGKNSFRFYDSRMDVAEKVPERVSGIETDLALLRRQLCERGKINGAYWQEYEPFLAIYRFMVREATRSKGRFSLLLLTIRNAAGGMPAPEQLTLCMDGLRAIIKASIRRGDVFTAYSASQYVLLLPNSTEEAVLEFVASRISGRFDDQFSSFSILLQCEATTFCADDLHLNEGGAAPESERQSAATPVQ